MFANSQDSSRHRCPHNPRPAVGNVRSNEPCTLTEYNKEFIQHPLETRQSCKPAAKPVAGDGLIDDMTTHKQDFIQHPLDKPYSRPKVNYKTPDGDIDLVTNYSQQYTRKPLEQTKSIRRNEQLEKKSGKFNGEPTYAADYRQWDISRREKVLPKNNYEPPSEPFDGSSHYNSDFVPYSGASQRQSLKPNQQPRISDEPFQDATEHRQSYVEHQVTARQPKDKPAYQPNPAPLDGVTNYRMDYNPRAVDGVSGKQPSYQPDRTPYRSDAPFEDRTTQKADYVGWQAERVRPKERDPYQKPPGEMDWSTTSQMDYTRKQLEPSQPVKPSYSRHMQGGKFDGTTNYKTEYLKWNAGERTQPASKKDQYSKPSDAPFEGLPTYRRDFPGHKGVPVTQSLKPHDPGYSSQAPLEGDTEYRKQYIDKKVDTCLAHQILHADDPADHGFELHEADARHVWYKPKTERG